MRSALCLSVVALASTVGICKADVITTYNVTNSSILTGIVNVDETAGNIFSSNLVLTVGTVTQTLTGSGGSGVGMTGFELSYFTPAAGYELLLTATSFGTIANYQGGSFFFSSNMPSADTSGNLVPAVTSSAPEISASGAIDGAVLLSGFILILHGRRRRFDSDHSVLEPCPSAA